MVGPDPAERRRCLRRPCERGRSGRIRRAHQRGARARRQPQLGAHRRAAGRSTGLAGDLRPSGAARTFRRVAADLDRDGRGAAGLVLRRRRPHRERVLRFAAAGVRGGRAPAARHLVDGCPHRGERPGDGLHRAGGPGAFDHPDRRVRTVVADLYRREAGKVLDGRGAVQELLQLRELRGDARVLHAGCRVLRDAPPRAGGDDVVLPAGDRRHRLPHQLPGRRGGLRLGAGRTARTASATEPADPLRDLRRARHRRTDSCHVPDLERVEDHAEQPGQHLGRGPRLPQAVGRPSASASRSGSTFRTSERAPPTSSTPGTSWSSSPAGW